MNNIMILILLYYMLTTIIASIASLTILLDNKYMPSEDVFGSKKGFLQNVFLYQFAIWKAVKDDINIIGIIILEILVTFSVWFMNILVLFCILIILIFKIIKVAFYKIFKKR